MPYQKTKEGRLVNEITLGDGYPLSNDKQPLKVGGEASIINVSSPTPDGSVDGEVEVKGKLRAKDTVIQGDLKVFSDSDTSPQFRFESRAGQNCQLQVKSAANTLTQLQLNNNQGSWYLKRKSSTTSLEFNDGTNTPLILDGDNVEFTNLTDGSITIDSFVDEDNMSSNSATKIPTQQSVKAYVDNEVAGLVDSAPAALDTLNELAAALNDDASFSTTITNSLATKVGLTGDETIAGNKTFSGLVKISAGGPQLIFVDTTDDDDHKIQFWDESNNVVHIIRTSDNTGGGLGDSLCIGSVENKPLQFITQDTTRMVIDGSGNVGIGTASPDNALHISYDSSAAEGSVQNNTGAVGLQIENTNASGVAAIHLRSSDSDGYIMYDDSGSNSGDFYFKTDGQDGNSVLTLLDGGNVGIGTESPDTSLHVIGETSIQPVNYANNQDAFLIKGGASNNDSWDGHVGVKFKSTSGGVPYLVLRATNSDTLAVRQSKVGIGTESPDALLELQDDANTFARINTSGSGLNSGVQFYDNDVYKWQVYNKASDDSLRFKGSSDFATIDSSGNVGIGTTSPNAALEVKTTGDTLCRLSTDGDSGDVAHLQLYRNSAAYAQFHYEADGGTNAGLHLTDFRDDTNSHIVFNTRGDNERMRIESDGKVGIGTTSPSTPLHINKVITNNADNSLLTIQGDRDTGDLGTEKVLIDFTMTDSNANNYPQVKIGAAVGQNADADTQGKEGSGAFVIYTAPGTSNTDAEDNTAERMRVDYQGNVGIGTTSPSYPLHVKGGRILVDGDGSNSMISLQNASGNRFANILNTGGDSDSTIAFQVGEAGSPTEAMIIHEDGRVGIGVSSPQSTLHVDEGDIRIDTASGGTQALRFSEANDTKAQIQYRSGDEELNLMTDDASSTAQKRITIKSEQDATAVGIGTNSPTTTLDVEGTVSYKTVSLSSSSDALDVSGATIVVVSTSSGNVLLGGFANGVAGQIIHLLKRTSANTLRIENNESTGTQKIYTSTNADKNYTNYGGMTLYCDGNNWFEIGS